MIIAFTGAGISKPSGIPTFNEMGNIRDKLDRGFAIRNPKEFQDTLDALNATCESAQPNDAHIALAEFNIPVITMNIDSLHRRAGTKNLIEVHGSLRDNNVVLYGDTAPMYSKALDWIYRLNKDDVLLIIGTSFYTSFSADVKNTSELTGSEVIVINDDAEHKVRQVLEAKKNKIGNFD